MSQQMKAAMRQGAPWRKGIAWWVVLVEGLLMLAIGIFMLAQLQRASHAVIIGIGIYLVISSVLQLVGGIRYPHRMKSGRFEMLRGVIGLVIGLVAVVEPFVARISFRQSQLILGVGFLISGLIGMYSAIAIRPREGEGRVSVLSGLLSVIMAVVVFTLTSANASILNWIGVLAIVFGIVLIVYSFMLHRMRSRREVVVQ